jgi:hypothetical protein
LKAGQAIVTEFAETATDMLIPTLQQGTYSQIVVRSLFYLSYSSRFGCFYLLIVRC